MAAVEKQKITCCLCGIGKCTKLGPIVTNEGYAVHVTCMIYSSGVWVRSSSPQPMFAKNSAGLIVCNDKFRPHTMGFGEVVERSRPCSSCSLKNASLYCSVTGCNKSYHIPCALTEKGKTFIFHAKMVYHADEGLSDSFHLGVLRSGRFLVCSNHNEWEENLTWKLVQSHITGDPELLNAISIDFDLLPESIQIAVSTMTQLSIVNPKSNAFACKYMIIQGNMYMSWRCRGCISYFYLT